MARKQVLVQLNDQLLADLDRAIAASGHSRSQLVRTAIAEYLERFLEDDIDRQYVEAYTRVPQDEHDPWSEAAARTTLADEPWDDAW